MLPRVEIKTEADAAAEVVDRSSTESLEVPRDRHGRCLMLHSCDLRRHITRLSSHRQELEASGGSVLDLPKWALPSQNWRCHGHAPAVGCDEDVPWANWKPLSCNYGDVEVTAAAKQSILHLADHSGFDSVCRTPLSVLADVLGCYIRSLCLEMGAMADSQFPNQGSNWALLLQVLQCRQVRRGDPLALERYWVQNVWNVTVRRQRAVLELRKSLSRAKPPDTGSQHTFMTVINVGNARRTTSPAARGGSPKSLLPLTALGCDALQPTVKVIGSLSSSSSPSLDIGVSLPFVKSSGTGSGRGDTGTPSPYGGPSPSSFLQPSPIHFSPFADNQPTLGMAMTPPALAPSPLPGSMSPDVIVLDSGFAERNDESASSSSSLATVAQVAEQVMAATVAPSASTPVVVRGASAAVAASTVAEKRIPSQLLKPAPKRKRK